MLTRDDFAGLYAAQGPRLLRAARVMLAYDYHRADASGEAEDLTEDVWARLWERWGELDAVPSPGYLYTALRWAALDAARRRQLVRWCSLDEPVSATEDDGGDGDGAPRWRWLADPTDAYAQLVTRLDLAAALRLLTVGERRALFVRHGSDQRVRWRARARLAQCAALEAYAPAIAS